MQRLFPMFPLTIKQLRQMQFCLVMGNEGQGISQDMAESADQLVHISMPGQAGESRMLLLRLRNSHV